MERANKRKYTTKEIRGGIISLYQSGKTFEEISDQLSIHK